MAPLFNISVNSYSIGYVVFNFPRTPQQCRMTLRQQIQCLVANVSHRPTDREAKLRYHEIMTQIASQYLEPLLRWQMSDDPSLHDPKSPQYYNPSALLILNWLCVNQNVCRTIAYREGFLGRLVDRINQPGFILHMKTCIRQGPVNAPSQFEAFEYELCILFNFLNSLSIYNDFPTSYARRGSRLMCVLEELAETYRNQKIGVEATKLAVLFSTWNTDHTNRNQWRQRHSELFLSRCGWDQCAKEHDLIVSCGKCHIQSYCSNEHLEHDRYHHDRICNKGFIELPQSAPPCHEP